MTPQLNDALLPFGATGDLSFHNLLPSLAHLLRDLPLPAGSWAPVQTEDSLPVTVSDKLRVARNP